MDYLDQPGRIYVIRANVFRTSGPVKIGFTGTGDPTVRLRDLQTGCPWPLEMVGHVAGKRRHESWLHNCLRVDRMAGEWFAPTENVLTISTRILALGFAFDDDGEYQYALWAA